MKPTPVEIATVAAPLVAMGRDPRDAVAAARQLIEIASEPVQGSNQEIRLNTKDAAKAVGYVSRNYKNMLHKLCVEKWSIISNLRSSSFGSHYHDGDTLFKRHDVSGWPQDILDTLIKAKMTRK